MCPIAIRELAIDYSRRMFRTVPRCVETVTIRRSSPNAADVTVATHVAIRGLSDEYALSDKHGAGWRPDIQVLRGLAVLLVVIQHAGFHYLPGGFLGVDIFFVISGFLMTGIIVDAIDDGRFTFAGFYIRRIRRLLPAAYSTTIASAVVGAILLDPWEFKNLVDQVAGAFTFTINFILRRRVAPISTATRD